MSLINKHRSYQCEIIDLWLCCWFLPFQSIGVNIWSTHENISGYTALITQNDLLVCSLTLILAIIYSHKTQVCNECDEKHWQRNKCRRVSGDEKGSGRGFMSSCSHSLVYRMAGWPSRLLNNESTYRSLDTKTVKTHLNGATYLKECVRERLVLMCVHSSIFQACKWRIKNRPNKGFRPS